SLYKCNLFRRLKQMFRRTVIIASLVIGLAGTLGLAQGLRSNRAKGAGRRGLADRALTRIEKNLALTPAQTSGIEALAENRRKETEALQQELRQKRQALAQLLRQP